MFYAGIALFVYALYLVLFIPGLLLVLKAVLSARRGDPRLGILITGLVLMSIPLVLILSALFSNE